MRSHKSVMSHLTLLPLFQPYSSAEDTIFFSITLNLTQWSQTDEYLLEECWAPGGSQGSCTKLKPLQLAKQVLLVFTEAISPKPEKMQYLLLSAYLCACHVQIDDEVCKAVGLVKRETCAWTYGGKTTSSNKSIRAR